MTNEDGKSLAGTYGTYMWHPEHGLDVMHPEDRDRFDGMDARGKLFRCAGFDGTWITLVYGQDSFRTRPGIYQVVPEPVFKLGSTVQVKSSEDHKRGNVVDIVWHFERQAPMYFLAFNGKRSSRRYYEEEMSAVSAAS